MPRHPNSIHVDQMEWTEQSHGSRFRVHRKQLGGAAGGKKLGCSLYELPPGCRSWPYHYHYEVFMVEAYIANTQLNRLISPEIKNDEFYAVIQQIAREAEIKTVLEIGSSSGQGSTEAFVIGLRENQNQPMMFCLEISKPRFDELKKHYANAPFVKCYNTSSVALEQFPEADKIITFYNTTQTLLNDCPLERILEWRRQEMEYIKTSGVDSHGIRTIKQEHNIDFFDVVLIDGSEFTGTVELDEVYGAKFILLDDIKAFKNYENHQRLLVDINYALIHQSLSLRNGYSVFKHIDKN